MYIWITDLTNYQGYISKHPEIVLLNQDVVNVRRIMQEFIEAQGVDTTEGLPTLVYISDLATQRAIPVQGENTIPIVVDGEKHILGRNTFSSISSISIHPHTVAAHAQLAEENMSLRSLLAEIPKSILTLEPSNRRLIRRIGVDIAINVLHTLKQAQSPSPDLTRNIMYKAEIV